MKIPDNVKSIGECSFYECSKLQEVEIPKNVEKIDYEAFSECQNFQTVIFVDD